MTDEQLGTYLMSLSARITELEAHVATSRQFLASLGVTSQAYDDVHNEIAERYREKHRQQLGDAVAREREQRAQIDRLLQQHKSEPQ